MTQVTLFYCHHMNTAPHSFGKSLFELLSSMRFAISLLSILAVASIVGTVLKQAEPYNNYIIQFGPFWFQVFEKLGLYDVYHAAWFLLILTFLVVSTSVCIYRNAPNFVREMKSFREHVSEQSLNAFKHRHEAATELPPAALAASAQRYLEGQGYKVKNLPREDGVLLAAKAGSWNRLGYLLAHSAIVMICIGGLMDGNLVFKVQQLLGYKKIETRDIRKARCRRFRAWPLPTRRSAAACKSRGLQRGRGLPECGRRLSGAGSAVYRGIEAVPHRALHDGANPKASRATSSCSTVPERKSGQRRCRQHPLIHDGIAIYQASFADGGTA